MRQLDINNNFSYGVRINIIITVMLDMLLRSFTGDLAPGPSFNQSKSPEPRKTPRWLRS